MQLICYIVYRRQTINKDKPDRKVKTSKIHIGFDSYAMKLESSSYVQIFQSPCIVYMRRAKGLTFLARVYSIRGLIIK